MLKTIISFLLSHIPTTKIIAFNSFPDYTDNAYAMFAYLYKNGYTKRYKMVWLINNKNKIKYIRKQVNAEGFQCLVVGKMTIRGLWFFVRSRYCFYTHGILNSIPLKQHTNKMINLWHGMPLKVIGLKDNRTEPYTNIDCYISTSEPFLKILSECFGVSEKHGVEVGQPRCDLLFEETDFYEKKGIDRCQFDKIGIWLPTYRYSIVETEKRVDGEFNSGFISFLDENGLSRLDKDLQSLRQLLIIKLHPMDKSQLYNFRHYNNIIIIKQKDFDSQLYPLLGSTDYLLTDFSSVCIDYDILKKPMAFVINDYDSFAKTRGFLFDDVLSLLPGPIIDKYEDLIAFMENPYYTPPKMEFNKYSDNNASKRLAEFLEL